MTPKDIAKNLVRTQNALFTIRTIVIGRKNMNGILMPHLPVEEDMRYKCGRIWDADYVFDFNEHDASYIVMEFLYTLDGHETHYHIIESISIEQACRFIDILPCIQLIRCEGDYEDEDEIVEEGRILCDYPYVYLDYVDGAMNLQSEDTKLMMKLWAVNKIQRNFRKKRLHKHKLLARIISEQIAYAPPSTIKYLPEGGEKFKEERESLLKLKEEN